MMTKSKSTRLAVFIIVAVMIAAAAFFALSACDGNERYTVTYLASAGGSISGEATQVVAANSDAAEITAVSDVGYRFVKWSDGEISSRRIDRNITCDLEVTAIFDRLECAARYFVRGEGGRIDGDTSQLVLSGEDAQPVTAVPEVGYTFAGWSDGKTEATRLDSNLMSSVWVYAQFAINTYSVKYEVKDSGGTITGETDQTVDHGSNARTVKAVPAVGYTFTRWSDGETEATRTDTNITADKCVYAEFTVNTYSARYAVDGVGGSITGETEQSVDHGSTARTVKAVPASGYTFAGWSDGSMELERRDEQVTDNYCIYAFFEPTERTFEYDYGIAAVGPYVSTVTIRRGDVHDNDFVLPAADGYTFEGWYADPEYKKKVVNREGVYMLGNYGFLLDTDTLYARWSKDGEDTGVVYNVLVVFVERVDAVVHVPDLGEDVHVEYTMSGIERAFCFEACQIAAEILTDWFDNAVKFEIDAYFTKNVADENDIHKDPNAAMITREALREADAVVTKFYKDVIVGYSFGDVSSSYFHGSFAYGGGSYPSYRGTSQFEIGLLYHRRIATDEYQYNKYRDSIPVYQALQGYRNRDEYYIYYKYILRAIDDPWQDDKYCQSFIYKIIDEICRIAQEYYDCALWGGYVKSRDIRDMGVRDWLLGQYEYNGELIGVPPEYWSRP